MDLAARRPHISAGIALASAAVIAAGPIAQHLPKLDAAHYLPQVSVTDINLTDAASPMMDLFAGVENELASLAGGVSAAAVPAAALTDLINPAALPLPLATWVNAFQKAGTNLETIYNTWNKAPFPVAQQVAANWIQYATDYIVPFHTAANNAVNLFFGNKSNSMVPLLSGAWSDYLSGNISGAVSNVYQALWGHIFSGIGQPLESILKIPAYATQNLANATNYLTGTFVTVVGLYTLIEPPLQVSNAIGSSLQAASKAWGAGDPVGALNNLLNTPGAAVNTLLNGAGTAGNYGLLSPNSGLIGVLANNVGPTLAQQIVAPNAQNIAQGGSLAIALQNLGNQLVNGWPNLSAALGTLGSQLTTMLQGVPGFLSTLPSMLSNSAGLLASNVGLLISNLLKLL